MRLKPPYYEQDTKPRFIQGIELRCTRRNQARYHRHPQLGSTRVFEAVRHHAHDGVGRVVQDEPASDNAGIGAETAYPRSMTHHHYIRGTSSVVFREERATERSGSTNQRKERCGHSRDGQRCGLTMLSEHLAPVDRPYRRERLETSGVLLPGPECPVRDFANGCGAGPLARPNHEDAIGLSDRQRPYEHFIEDGEDGRVRANRNRKRADGNQGEAGIPSKSAKGVTQVLNDASHPCDLIYHLLTFRMGHLTSLNIIEAPSILGLSPTGVEELPHALQSAGLYSRLGVQRSVRVEPPPYHEGRDPVTGMLNSKALVDYTLRLADEVGAALDHGECPLVLGGDCSILLGNLLALARRGLYGLLFLDGHADFYQPQANVNGQAASSELAFATGRGPAMLTSFDGHRPLIRDEHVVTLGMRDAEEAAAYGSQPLPGSIRAYDLAALRRIGVEAAMLESLDHLRSQALNGLWLHFDVDVLDDAIMPAVDYRLPDGLSWAEAETALKIALGSGAVAGVDVTIFNPRLDRDGSITQSLVELLSRVLRDSQLRPERRERGPL
jgi:arginase